MSDEIILHEKMYVSSKKAAEQTGYAQDYIGQLCRGGLIDAERVGGLWYVSIESLQNYEKNAEVARSFVPVSSGSGENESSLTFEGKDYISASRASKLSGYNQDYVGQLARAGKIPSRQIGNRWYVDSVALLAHKSEKDALLAAVQSQSVGLQPTIKPIIADTTEISSKPKSVISTYMQESRDLIPVIPEKETLVQYPMSNFSEIRTPSITRAELKTSSEIQRPLLVPKKTFVARKRPSTRVLTTSFGALTIILMISVGIFTFKDAETLAINSDAINLERMTAGAAEAAGSMGDIVENWISPLLVYNREH